MKYQSELINEIVDKRGHKFPSLHYQSECVELWIEEAKGSYPKLCDYEAEWLNYINNHETIGKFPYETLKDVTEATVNNVVPYSYKSAILRGQTLVNICDITNILVSNKSEVNGSTITIEPTGYINIGLVHDINVNDKYTLILNDLVGDFSSIQANLSNKAGSVWTGTVDNITLIGNCQNRIITPKQNETEFVIRIKNNGQNNISFKPIFLLGENKNEQDYFEGMQSVKLPVLTTSNEDGTKTNILSCNEDVELGSVGEVKDELNLLTGQLTQRTETRAYQEGDEANSEVITDMANTRYKLPKESIKTVDLTITNQDGEKLNRLKPIEGTMHISTSSDTIQPTFSGEIPVEATTQNLSSFIEE